LLHAAPPDFRVTYGYRLEAQFSAGLSQVSECSFSAIRANDQLLVAFSQAATPSSIKAQFYTIQPRTFSYGSFTFETDAFWPTRWEVLVNGG
jgi:hypothetical protein